MCGCHKRVKRSEKARFLLYHKDPRFFIYRIIAHRFEFLEVKKGENPLQIAKKHDWEDYYLTNEHKWAS